MPIVVEFTVEPFVEGNPGPHVQAAVNAASANGLDVDFGPFGTTARADDAGRVAAAVGEIVRAALDAGASRVVFQVTRA